MGSLAYALYGRKLGESYGYIKKDLPIPQKAQTNLHKKNNKDYAYYSIVEEESQWI